jgi:putative oxidoreductase
MARPAYRDRVLGPEPGPAAGPELAWWVPAAHALLRVGAGLLFMQHGLQKLFGFFGGQTVPLASQLGVAGILELVGGVLIVVGLFTRPVAAILALEMLAAIAIAHLPRGGAPIQNGAELPLLYALIFIFLAVAGPGPYSVDASVVSARRRVVTGASRHG